MFESSLEFQGDEGYLLMHERGCCPEVIKVNFFCESTGPTSPVQGGAGRIKDIPLDQEHLLP